MEDQRHIINELYLDISVPEVTVANDIQNRLSNLLKTQIPSLLNQYCNELSDPQIISRIDSLEVNLGKLQLDDMEGDFTKAAKQKIYEALSAKFAEAKLSANSSPSALVKAKRFAQIELLDHFLEFGWLPWWAGNKRPKILEEAFTFYLENSTRHEVTNWFQKVLRQPVTKNRLIRNFSDSSLYLLVEKLAGLPSEEFLVQLFTFVDRQIASFNSLRGKISSSAKTRVSSWQYVFFELQKNEGSFIRDPFIKHYFLHLATAFKTSPAKLAKDIVDLKELPKQLISKTLYQEFVTLASGQGTDVFKEPGKPLQKDGIYPLKQTLLRLLSPLNQDLKSLMGNKDDPKTKKQLVKHLFKRLHKINSLLEKRDFEVRKFTENYPAAAQFVLRLLILIQKSQSPDRVFNWLSSQSDPSTDDSGTQKKKDDKETMEQAIADWLDNLASTAGELLGSVQKKEAVSHKRPTLQSEEEVYISNAGLVMLAPYFNRFFRHLDLLNDNDFIDTEARYKAMHILHFLSYGEESTIEFLLPLNKILCGAELADPVEIDYELTANEKEACAHLIVAAVANAPILKNMSVDGFRGSFILRNGILLTRDRNWLLQVEKQAYDVVLKEIPWSFSKIKLPWMKNLIFVEW